MQRMNPIKGRESKYTADGTYLRDLPSCSTVGHLKVLLSHLPDDLPIGMSCPFRPVWYNIGRDDEHLTFEEEWDAADPEDFEDDSPAARKRNQRVIEEFDPFAPPARAKLHPRSR